jgi:probable rRNA maturation factor
MTVHLEIVATNLDSSGLPDFKQCVERTLSVQEIQRNVDLTIVLGDDEYIHKLNLEFLDQDKPTDVLAFPAGHNDPDSGHQYLGDIIISYPRAEKQAEFAGHPITSELILLTIHGVLHLLGYDHDQPDREAEMWQIQSAILSDIGIEINPPYYSKHIEG